jgi:50S ribosomal protein L16 3-hydroxylase
MDLDRPQTFLGGLSASAFMRCHWQKKPLVVRAALPGALARIDRARLFALAASDGVESRLVVRSGERWSVRQGPIARRALPARSAPDWTVLVQGVDLHDDAAHRLLRRFRFVGDARLDDVMCSWAADGGGVGPHVDSYDVFLLQVQGVRRWRIGRVRDATLRDDVPLAMLRGFAPEAEWRLAAGDLLYLPPGWAHEGLAEGECMTCSIGFRAPRRERLGREVLQALLDDEPDAADEPLYADRAQPATLAPGRIPHGLQAFAQDAVRRVIARPHAVERALGEVLSEPKPGVVFERREARLDTGAALRLDRRTRMMYDTQHVYLNGESYRAAGGDARLMRRLADERRLALRDLRRLSEEARALVGEWLAAGWLQAADEAGEGEA